jgi:transcriptional regulator with XRE-family HTH domain
MDNPIELGERILAVRSHTGLNKAVFGARIGLSGTSVNNLETGAVKNPSGHVLAKISNEFDISLDWLQHGQGEMMKTNIQGNSFNSSGAVSGGQNLTGVGNQTSFTPQGMDLNLITGLEEKIAGLERLLAEKDERIQELKETIAHLRKS